MTHNKFFKIIIITLVLVASLSSVALLSQAALAAGLEQQTAPAAPQAGTATVVFSDTLEATITDHQETEMQVIVPDGAVDGDITVQTVAGISNGAPFAVAILAEPPIASAPIAVSGTITASTTWDQNILVTGDIEVSSGITLTIAPGVTVYFADGDDRATGRWADKTEIAVFGTLLAEGNPTRPITLTSNNESPVAGDWGGIVIRTGSTDSVLQQAVIQYATEGLSFWRHGTVNGTYAHAATLTNSTVQFNLIGIATRARPGYPAGGQSVITANVRNNHIHDNTDAGVYLHMSLGYGTSNDFSIIQNNLIENNDVGVHVYGGSWWEGHTDVKPQISNNTIRNNTTAGLEIQAYGASDNSGSDTDVQPIIEHNLLQNPASSNIRLFFEPYGNEADGTTILSPEIRYNTISDAATGILIEESQTHDTLNPDIHHNIFYGFDPYAINNTTSRSITAQENYWGSTTTEWDLGGSGMVAGTVDTTNYLNSSSAPILTRFVQGNAIVGENVDIYGANFVAPDVEFHNGISVTPSAVELLQLTAMVPDGVEAGDVVVSTTNGDSNGFNFSADALPIMSGAITTNTTWHNDVLVAGDVEIASGVTLTITPGVTVYFADGDDRATGRWSDKTEIAVFGALLAAGSPTTPITFTAYSTAPTAGDWGGIVIRAGSTVSALEHTVIQYAEEGITFWRADNISGNHTFSATLSDSVVQFNSYGITTRARAGYPDGGNSEIIANIINNHIHHNINAGVYLHMSLGYRTSNDFSLIQNNLFEDNDTGVHVYGGSWWAGHTDVKPQIINNIIRNNTTSGIEVHASGSSDGSGSDTDVQPIIEHNLLQNPGGNNLYLRLHPYGSDGIQILKPVIRYNTIMGAANGILIEDTESYDTLEPEIHHNIFYGFSEYAIYNTTPRLIDAQQNYWGSTEAEWALGANEMVTGTITATNHLDVYSAPILTYVSPGIAEESDTLKLYGANFFGEVLPVAAPDTYSADPNEILNISAPGILANDTDADGDELTARLDSNVSSGTLQLNPDGSFTYTPETDFTGTDQFYYHATDGKGNSDSVSVTIQVEPEPEIPHQIFLPLVIK